jgi:hypothetical protein
MLSYLSDMTSGVKRISVAERRARLAARHALADPAQVASPAEVARRLVALHSTDPASVFLSIRARSARATVAAIEAALYEERTLLRMLGMRRTMFVVADELAPIIQSSCTDAIAVTQRKRYTQLIAQAGVGDARGYASSRQPPRRRCGEGRGHRSSAVGRRASTADADHHGRGQPTAAPRTSPPGCSSSSPPKAASCGRPQAPGPAASRWSPVAVATYRIYCPGRQGAAELVRRWLNVRAGHRRRHQARPAGPLAR